MDTNVINELTKWFKCRLYKWFCGDKPGVQASICVEQSGRGEEGYFICGG